MNNMDLKTQKLLWKYFTIAQLDILQVVPSDLAKFRDFLNGKTEFPPFTPGSEAWNVCLLCGKINLNLTPKTSFL